MPNLKVIPAIGGVRHGCLALVMLMGVLFVATDAFSEELQGTQTIKKACDTVACGDTMEMHDHEQVNFHLSCTKLDDQSKAKAGCNLVPGNKKEMWCEAPTLEGDYWDCTCVNRSGNWPDVNWSIKCP